MSDQSFIPPSLSASSADSEPSMSLIDCGTQLTISSLAALATQLKQALDDGRATVLQCANVSHVDTAGLQMLLAFMQDAAGKTMHVECEAPSELFKQSAALLGMSAQLGI